MLMWLLSPKNKDAKHFDSAPSQSSQTVKERKIEGTWHLPGKKVTTEEHATALLKYAGAVMA